MKAGMQTKIIFYENNCKTYDSHQLTPCVHSARLHRFQQRNCRPSCVLVFSSAHPLSVLPYRALCGSDAKLLTWPHSVTNTQQSLFRVHHKQVQMYYRSGIATCYCIGAGRHLVFTHQVVALFLHEMMSRRTTWKCDVKSKILPCQLMCIYSKIIPTKFSPDLIWNRLFEVAPRRWWWRWWIAIWDQFFIFKKNKKSLNKTKNNRLPNLAFSGSLQELVADVATVKRGISLYIEWSKNHHLFLQ